MGGHARHEGSRRLHIKDDIDLSLISFQTARAAKRQEWAEAIEREMAHLERRDKDTLHDIKMPKSKD